MSEQIKRYRVSYRDGITEDNGRILPAGYSQPMVLASDHDAEIAMLKAERDTAREMLRKAHEALIKAYNKHVLGQPIDGAPISEALAEIGELP